MLRCNGTAPSIHTVAAKCIWVQRLSCGPVAMLAENNGSSIHLIKDDFIYRLWKTIRYVGSVDGFPAGPQARDFALKHQSIATELWSLASWLYHPWWYQEIVGYYSNNIFFNIRGTNKSSNWVCKSIKNIVLLWNKTSQRTHLAQCHTASYRDHRKWMMFANRKGHWEFHHWETKDTSQRIKIKKQLCLYQWESFWTVHSVCECTGVMSMLGKTVLLRTGIVWLLLVQDDAFLTACSGRKSKSVLGTLSISELDVNFALWHSSELTEVHILQQNGES